MTVAKLPTDGSPVTITSAHIRALGSCDNGVRQFRRVFPDGVTLTQETLNKYYRNARTVVKGLHHRPDWLFSRVGVSLNHADRRTPWDILYYSRDKAMVKSRKAVQALEQKREAEKRAAIAAINKKYAPRIVKARAVGLSAARAWLNARKKKAPVLSLSAFAAGVNARLNHYY